MGSLLNLQSDRFGLKTIFHCLMGIVILVARVLAYLPFDLLYMATKKEFVILNIVLGSILDIGIVFFLVRLHITKILKMPFSDFRVGKPKNIFVWTFCAFALPLSVSAFFIFSGSGTFIASGLTSEQGMLRVLRAVFDICLVAGITEELIFRGFIMRLLERRWNKKVAIIAPSVLFSIVHIFNMEQPNAIDIFQLMIAGTFVGVMFSVIVYQSASIWASALVHGVWNLIIIGGILRIDLNPGEAIFPYMLKTQSALLTGGSFGIESSLPAISGYGLVILFVYTVYMRKRTVSKS